MKKKNRKERLLFIEIFPKRIRRFDDCIVMMDNNVKKAPTNVDGEGQAANEKSLQ